MNTAGFDWQVSMLRGEQVKVAVVVSGLSSPLCLWIPSLSNHRRKGDGISPLWHGVPKAVCELMRDPRYQALLTKLKHTVEAAKNGIDAVSLVPLSHHSIKETA